MTLAIAQIALNSPLRSLYDYRTGGLDLQVGQRVEVSFGKRKNVGIVAALKDSSEVPDSRLKSINKVLDEQPSISADLLEIIIWAADYYQHPVGEALFHALPARLREDKSIEHGDFLHWKPTEKALLVDPESLGRANRQKEALKALQKHSDGLGQHTLKGLSISNQTLKALEGKGLAVQEIIHKNLHKQPEHLLRTSSLKLNQEQQAALDMILKQNDSFHSYLLQGVTGSGKTEVYLQLIEKVVSGGKQALVLVPEIGLTPQTLHRFQQRFSCEIVSLHSGMTDAHRFKAWYKARQGEASIIIGTRSAIFSEIPNLGVIVVDEEHDLSYKQQEGFRYSARDLAVMRGRKADVPVILGSATPSLESIHNVEIGRYQLLRLDERANHSKAPEICLLDIRKLELQGGLSHNTIAAIRERLEKNEQVLVFINRRGYAPALICSSCGWLATCPFCDARFTLHKNKNKLICHHCNFQQEIMSSCPSCDQGDMHALGQGTEKVEEILSMHFKKFPVLRIDRDSTERKNALKERLDFIHSGRPCVLVGTQLLTKGHHFPKVNLVCIIDADRGFFSADFRAMERMGQTLTQISGRAGRESGESKVILQTELPDHPLLTSLVNEGYPALAKKLLDERESLAYPPFGFLCLIRADAVHLDTSMHFLAETKNILGSLGLDELNVMGPVPATMQKRAGRHRAQLLLQSKQRSVIQRALRQGIVHFPEISDARKVRWSIDVDPQETF